MLVDLYNRNNVITRVPFARDFANWTRRLTPSEIAAIRNLSIGVGSGPQIGVQKGPP
jgi:hypothetical protein